MWRIRRHGRSTTRSREVSSAWQRTLFRVFTCAACPLPAFRTDSGCLLDCQYSNLRVLKGFFMPTLNGMHLALPAELVLVAAA